MAINVRMAASRSAWGKGDSTDVGIFIENNSYHYLLPEIIDLQKKFGKFIDQYGDAFFEPHTLQPVLTALKGAQERANKMKKVESLIAGVDQESKKEIRIDVYKEEIQGIIGGLISAAEKAKNEGKYLIFVGD